jgi:hypothetical protein
VAAVSNRAIGPAIVVATFIVTRLLNVPVGLGVVTIAMGGDIGARVRANLAGHFFDVATLGNGMPLLDRELLLHDLPRSLWYLHSQPPLFNALVALILRFPGDLALNYQWFSWMLALAFYLGTFALMRRLGVRGGVAAACVVAFMVLPNAIWHERAVYYGLPLAALLLAAALFWERAIRKGSVFSLAASCTAIMLLPLTRAFFTPVWCAILLGAMVVVFARFSPLLLRKAIAAAIIPFAFVAAFQFKQYVVFRQVLGSSWFGCNLAAMTALMSADKQAALAAGKVSKLVTVYRNAPPEEFLPYFRVAQTGVPALDALVKSTGQPNFNHSVYLQVGRVYLRDTLYLIAHHPLKYLFNVVNSAYIFCGYQIGLYFDRPSRFLARHTPAEVAAPFAGAALLAAAIASAIRSWRTGDAQRRAVIGFLLFNVAYVIAVSCFFEKSEGPVYRFQIEAFLWAFIAIAAEGLVRAVQTSLRERTPLTPRAPLDVRD